MKSRPDDHYYRVVSSSGDVFYTRARTAAEFVLDPVFVKFMVLCVFLFTSLMLALGLPVIPQIILFSAGVVSTFFWLSIVITIYLWVIKLVGSRTILTPVLLFPMQVANGLFMNYVLNIFETGYIEGFGFWEIAVRTAVIIFCLDIMHGKFVAPMHGKTVTLDANGNIVDRRIDRRAQASLTDDPAMAVQVAQRPLERTDTNSAAAKRSADEISTDHAASVPKTSDLSEVLIVGRKTFDLSTIYAIRSEDHYLVLQFADGSEMVRGRLGEVVSKIDVRWGIQVNRSAWVPYAALEEVQQTPKGQIDVTLKNGMKLRVANSRKLLFEHGCNQYAPAVDWRHDQEDDG